MWFIVLGGYLVKTGFCVAKEAFDESENLSNPLGILVIAGVCAFIGIAFIVGALQEISGQ